MDRDFDYLDFDEESDQERAESSDDEIDILLHGTPTQKRKVCQRSVSGSQESSSEDEFEKEMNDELIGKVKEIERKRGPVSGDAKKKQNVLSNDDLLYDPNIDEDNEKWMENQRRSYLLCEQESSAKKQKKLPNSDAVLDCPACMTTLCLDCQRHDVYENQYRAMFVTNCKVDNSETLKYPKADKSSRKRKKPKVKTMDNSEIDDKFYPVKCIECNTVVAVYDDDEIYHFFNVLASY